MTDTCWCMVVNCAQQLAHTEHNHVLVSYVQISIILRGWIELGMFCSRGNGVNCADTSLLLLCRVAYNF